MKSKTENGRKGYVVVTTRAPKKLVQEFDKAIGNKSLYPSRNHAIIMLMQSFIEARTSATES